MCEKCAQGVLETAKFLFKGKEVFVYGIVNKYGEGGVVTVLNFTNERDAKIFCEGMKKNNADVAGMFGVYGAQVLCGQFAYKAVLDMNKLKIEQLGFSYGGFGEQAVVAWRGAWREDWRCA